MLKQAECVDVSHQQTRIPHHHRGLFLKMNAYRRITSYAWQEIQWAPVAPVTTMAKSAVLPRSSSFVSSRNLVTLKLHPSSMKPILPSNAMLSESKPKCRRQQRPSLL